MQLHLSFVKILISFNFMKIVIIQKRVLKNTFSYVFIKFFIIIWKSIFKIILLLLHSIEVIVQDTKSIDGLSTAITKKNELYNGLYYISVDAILFFKMATMKKKMVISSKEVTPNLLMY